MPQYIQPLPVFYYLSLPLLQSFVFFSFGKAPFTSLSQRQSRIYTPSEMDERNQVDGITRVSAMYITRAISRPAGRGGGGCRLGGCYGVGGDGDGG